LTLPAPFGSPFPHLARTSSPPDDAPPAADAAESTDPSPTEEAPEKEAPDGEAKREGARSEEAPQEAAPAETDGAASDGDGEPEPSPEDEEPSEEDATEEEDAGEEPSPLETVLGGLRWVRDKFEQATTYADQSAARLAGAAAGPLLWPLPIAMGAGVGVWMYKHPTRLASLDTNKLDKPERLEMLAWVGRSFAAFLLAYLVALVVHRLVYKRFDALAVLRRVGGWLSFAMALPFAVFLRLEKIETQSPKLAVVAALLAALAVARTFYFLPELRARTGDAEEEPPEPTLPRRALGMVLDAAPLLCAVGLALAYGWLLSRLAIANHHALNTRTTDLGYYDNIFYQSTHGKFLGCSFLRGGTHRSAHFDPILVLLSPLYLLSPRAKTILTLQSYWSGMGAIPVYLLAKHRLGRPLPALALAACYTMFPALHGANLYEFHSLTLITPLVLWLLFLFETKRTIAYYAVLCLLLLCREDVPLLLCFVGAYALLSGKPWGPRIGRRTIVFSLFYFVLAKFYFMSGGILGDGANKESYSYTYYYEELIPDRSSAKELFVSLLTNPTFVLKLVSEEAKVNFLFLLFVPLLALPLLAKRGRIMLIYGLAFTLLASRDPVYTVHFQYTSVLTPILFALVPMALEQARERGQVSLFGLDGKRLVAACAAGCLVASTLVSWKFGGVSDNLAFRGGFVRVIRKLTPEMETRYAWVSAQTARIPQGASVAATSRMGPHVSNRKEAYFYPDKATDFALIDETELKAAHLERHKKNVSSGEYEEIERHGRLVFLHRKKSWISPIPVPVPAN